MIIAADIELTCQACWQRLYRTPVPARRRQKECAGKWIIKLSIAEVYQGAGRSSAGKTELPRRFYKHLMTGVSHGRFLGGGGRLCIALLLPGIRAQRAGHAGGCVISNWW